MNPVARPLPNLADIARASHVRFGMTDIDGVFRGKFVSGEKAAAMAQGGGSIAGAVFGWDIADELLDNLSFTGPERGYPDIGLQLHLDTARAVPWENDQWLLLGDHTQANGQALPICPRQLLKKVLQKAKALGFEVKVGIEYEWFVLQETQASLREKDFRHLSTATFGMTNYSPFRMGVQQAFVKDLLTFLPQMDIPLEALHTEAGPGNFEAAIRYGDALETADRAVLFKQAVREIGQRHGLINTFMAKFSEAYAGCGGHLHQSLWQQGRSAFYDPEAPKGISPVMAHYIAGQLHAMPDLMAIYAPFVNSYKRLVPNYLAPVQASWGIDDRNTSLRVIASQGNAMRLETRTPGADANPYLAMAAAIASGLYGIEHQLPLTQDETPALSQTLEQATARLKSSGLARELLGDEWVNHFVQTREWEVRRYNRAVTDWELRRYLELV
jgi:glutamine synthetase